MECLGYAHLDDSAPKTRKPRQKRSTPAPSESTSESSAQFSSNSPIPIPPDSKVAPSDSISPHVTNPTSHITTASQALDYVRGLDALFDSVDLTLIPSIAHQDPSFSWDANLGLAEAPSLYPQNAQGEDAMLLYGTPDQQNTAFVDLFVPGMLGDPEQDPEVPFSKDSQTSSALSAPIPAVPTGDQKPVHLSSSLQHQDESDEDSDTEGIMSLVSPAITLDRTNDSNSLPFVLSSYLRWATRAFFEPLKAAQRKKDYLIERYMHSDGFRGVTTLVAIIMESLDKILC
ncbi:Fungal Zn(2)-Cys(6) binuclear cluster domain [Ceratobasidium sp. AG-Ba]|nr:Fungal Zn(2)-Cys(6) binuclear cluster domain [Ceratobasidium sp. AG-Ba]